MSGFGHIYERVDRADHHISELKAAMDEWWARDPGGWSEVHVDDPKQALREHRYVFSYTTAPDRVGWGIRIGDAVHNLRAALDNLAWHCAAQSGEPPWATEFPIFKDRARYLDEGHRKIRGIEDPRVRGIIDDVQPWQRGDDAISDPLWVLHEWNNTDKHRVVMPVLVAPADLEARILVETDNPFAAAMPVDVDSEFDEETGEITMYVYTVDDTQRIGISQTVRVGVGIRYEGEVADLGALLPGMAEQVRTVVDRIAE